MLARPLLGLVGAPPGLRAGAASGRGADLDGVLGDAPAARALGEALELVGGLVDRLEMALVLELLAGRGEVGVPDLGEAPAGELHLALAERGLELE